MTASLSLRSCMKETVLQNHSVIRNRQSNDQTPVAHKVKKGAHRFCSFSTICRQQRQYQEWGGWGEEKQQQQHEQQQQQHLTENFLDLMTWNYTDYKIPRHS